MYAEKSIRYGFNPRLREGGDRRLDIVCRTLLPFQSTPPRGRRPEFLADTTDFEVSIHASAREATSIW